jgi:DNA polymerase (family 10)
MNNKQVSKVLDDIQILLELKGENPFKARAYANAARAIETWPEPVARLAAEGRLGEIPGLGASLVERITELVTTGRMAYHEELAASIPPGLPEMLAIAGLGPRKVRAIYDQLGVATVGELEYACRENRLAALDGFGPKTQERVLQGIDLLKRSRGYHLIDRAAEDAEALTQLLLLHPDVWRAAVAGDVRRRMEVVQDIHIVVSHPAVDVLMPVVKRFGPADMADDGSLAVTGASGIPAYIHGVPDESFAMMLYHWTGSEGHRERIARHADARGITVTDRHIIRNRAVFPCPDESVLYDALGLQYIPPELREGNDEVELASRRALPDLLTPDSLLGVIHVHTTYSDGAHTVQEMAEAARAQGYRYIAICDHSRSAGYAHGLSIERVRQQQEEIDALNARYDGFRILKGIESDILPDGRLDYPDEVLATFDLVVASVHSGFHLSEADMTDRIVRAIRNPYTTILGHPTGRLLLARDGYKVDLRKIVETAAEHRVAIEVNANPHRLDLDWRHLRQVRECGVQVSIGPDAHHTAEIRYLDYGVGIARKGGLTARDVVNTLPAEGLVMGIKGSRFQVPGSR